MKTVPVARAMNPITGHLLTSALETKNTRETLFRDRMSNHEQWLLTSAPSIFIGVPVTSTVNPRMKSETRQASCTICVDTGRLPKGVSSRRTMIRTKVRP